MIGYKLSWAYQDPCADFWCLFRVMEKETSDNNADLAICGNIKHRRD